MKKFIAAAVLAGLATAAFAQTPAAPTITWGGYIDTGLTAAYNLQDRATVGYWGDDAGKSGGRFKLIGKVAAGDYGFNFELRGQGLPTTANTVAFANSGNTASVDGIYFDAAYAYANFFNKMVYTQVGIIDQRDSRTGGDAGASYSKETPGAIVVVKPIDGLSLNVFVAPTLTSSSNLVVDLTPAVSNVTSSVGGAYTVPSVVKVVGQARFANPQAFYATYKYSNGSWTGTTTGADTYTVTDFYAGAGLLAVPNLTAWLEYQNNNLNAGKLDGKQTITETVAYNFKDQGLAPLSAGLIAYEALYGDDLTTNGGAKDKTNVSFRVNPWVSYDLGGIIPKLEGAYFAGKEITGSGTGWVYTYDLGTATNTVASVQNYNNIALVEIKPSVKFQLNPTMYINLVASYMKSVGSDDVSFLGKNKSATSQITTQANFTYSF